MAFKLNQRIIDPQNNARGTIKYIGSVENTKGSWLGIDWDNPERGKHNGSHQGRNYFVTHTETSGSFVRETKISKGQTFQEAVQDRYGSTPEADPDMIEEIRKDINAPFLQLVGFEKVNQAQSNFAELTTISVRDKGVYGCAEPLDKFCPLVQVLDIAENLLTSWNTVAEMIENLTRLQNLNVSMNKLEITDDKAELLKKAFWNLKTLFMGEMDYDWDQVSRVLQFFGHLQVLHLYDNQITSINSPYVMNTLVELNLTGNPLQDWGTVQQFSQCSKLQILVLNRCHLTQIKLEKGQTGFQALKHLQINGNKLDNWASITCLNYLPLLMDLKYKDNPITESESYSNIRQVVIASIANLKIANGTEIEKVERFGAEVDYLKKYGLEYLQSVKDNNLEPFYAKYPRYEEFVKRFGAPEESELRVKDTSLKANLLKVKIVCPDHPEVKEISKALPPAMVVSKLRGLLTRLIKPSRGKTLVLSYASAKNLDFEVPLDNDMRDLFFYNVENGDTIFVRF